MITRTVQTRVMFRHPFQLRGMARPQPPGIYLLSTDEEELRGLSFITFRTIAAYLLVPALGSVAAHARHVPVNLDELDDCVLADRETAGPMPVPRLT